MAIAVLFTPPSVNAEQYDQIIRSLEEAGAGAPAGRRFHVCFSAGGNVRVLDVWDSPEAFGAFGQTLMPIMGRLGLDPGQPEVVPVHNIIVG